jgi:hypothetical protein
VCHNAPGITQCFLLGSYLLYFMYETTFSGGISILCSKVFLMYEFRDHCTDFALYAVQETWFWLHLSFSIAAAMLREL